MASGGEAGGRGVCPHPLAFWKAENLRNNVKLDIFWSKFRGKWVKKSNKNLKIGKFLHFLPWKFSCLPLELILPHLNPPWNKSWWCPWFDNAIHTKRKHVTSEIGRKLIQIKISADIFTYLPPTSSETFHSLPYGLKSLATETVKIANFSIFQFNSQAHCASATKAIYELRMEQFSRGISYKNCM